MRISAKLIKTSYGAYLVTSLAALAFYGKKMPLYVIDPILGSYLFILFVLPLIYLFLRKGKAKDGDSKKLFLKIFGIGLAVSIGAAVVGLAYIFLHYPS